MEKSLPLSDIRNKLSPFKNLIAMLENGLVVGTVDMHPFVIKEIEQCKVSIQYLSTGEENVNLK